MSMRVVLRGAAIAIAIAGAIDPAVAWTSRTRPEVSLVAASPRDGASTDALAHTLDNSFTIVRGPDAGAAATIVVGDRVPADLAPTTPAFAALNPVGGVSIDRVDVPDRAHLDSQIPVVFHATAPAGVQSVEARLSVNGLVVRRETIAPSPAGEISGALAFTPTDAGLTRVSVEIASGSTTAAADAAIDVSTTRWRMLAFDPRPSWASTFARREIERDTRFVVTTRVVTSPRTAATSGDAPTSLADRLDQYDVVMAGAPDALSSSDVDRLEAFARRGGALLLMMDRATTGPFARLAGATWTERQMPSPAPLDADTREGRLRGSDVVVADLAPGSSAIATIDHRPVIWRTPLGAGEVIVSGALDAWRERASSNVDFARFWQTIAADAAARALSPLDVRVSSRLVETSASFQIDASVGRLADSTAGNVTIAARLDGPRGSTPFRLWPTAPGTFSAELRAPDAPGVYRIVVDATINGETRHAETSFISVANVSQPSDRAMLAAWATAHGGAAAPIDDADRLETLMSRALHLSSSSSRAHPMRSPWWIVPFALAIGGEWWLRRRSGLA